MAAGGRGTILRNYEQWKTIHARETEARAAAERRATAAASPAPPTGPAAASGAAKKRLSYKEQIELTQMQGSIEATEAQLHGLEAAMADPDVIADHRRYAQVCTDLGIAQQRVAALYAHREELDGRSR